MQQAWASCKRWGYRNTSKVKTALCVCVERVPYRFEKQYLSMYYVSIDTLTAVRRTSADPPSGAGRVLLASKSEYTTGRLLRASVSQAHAQSQWAVSQNPTRIGHDTCGLMADILPQIKVTDSPSKDDLYKIQDGRPETGSYSEGTSLRRNSKHGVIKPGE